MRVNLSKNLFIISNIYKNSIIFLKLYSENFYLKKKNGTLLKENSIQNSILAWSAGNLNIS